MEQQENFMEWWLTVYGEHNTLCRIEKHSGNDDGQNKILLFWNFVIINQQIFSVQQK